MKLSDFQDNEGFEVVAKLLYPIINIVSNKKNLDVLVHKSKIDFAASVLVNTPDEMKKIFAILNRKEPEEYSCNGATILMDTLTFVSDPVLLGFFDSQGQTVAASGSVSTTGEATAESTDSSTIAMHDSGEK